VAQAVRIPAIGQVRDTVARGQPHPGQRLLPTVRAADKGLTYGVGGSTRSAAFARAAIPRVFPRNGVEGEHEGLADRVVAGGGSRAAPEAMPALVPLAR